MAAAGVAAVRVPSAVPAVEARHLSKRYRGADRPAVDDLELRVEVGEVFGLLGANGAGKTTLLKILLALVRPSAGSASIFGTNVREDGARRTVGYQPEQFRFPEWMTAEEVLTLHGRLAHMGRSEIRAAIAPVFERVGLSESRRKRIAQYSKGMQQRLALAQALVAGPRLVLLDEPTSALDPLGRRDVRDLIRSLRDEGVTVFLNSHLLSEVELVCDRVAIVDRGKIVRQGRLSELLDTPMEISLTVGTITPGLLEALRPLARDLQPNGRTIRLTLKTPDAAPAVAHAVIAAGADLWEMRRFQPSLEDVFVGIVRPSDDA